MNFMDILIRHQPLLFAGIALLAAVLLLQTTPLCKLLISLLAPGVIAPTPETANAGRFYTLFPMSFIVITVIAAVVFGAVVGLFEPVPKTVALSFPEPSRDLPNNKKLLIFVHGWDGDPDGTWQKFPKLVQQDHLYDSFNIITISYPTYLTRRNLDIREMARWLNDGFERNGIYARYNGIWFITHSMGGLIARELLITNRLGRDNKPYKQLIEIATPHQGASVAELAKALGVSRGLMDDLTPGSPFLSILRDDWNSLKDRPKTFCLTNPHDMIVTEDSATAQCDDYLKYPQWGHIEMAKPQDLKDERYTVPMSRINKGV